LLQEQLVQIVAAAAVVVVVVVGQEKEQTYSQPALMQKKTPFAMALGPGLQK